MSSPDGSNGRVRFTPAAITVVLAFIAQTFWLLSWAFHQEARITALEVSLAEVSKRSESADRMIDDRTRTLIERIDRQETPLARRVDAVETRGIELSTRVLNHEGRINELYNTITRR